jgi:hypothetical protein
VLRADLARALAAAPQPARLEAALALLLDASLDIRDTFTILTSAVGREDTRPTAEAFAFTNVDALLARLPGDTGTQLVNVLIGGCDLAAAESHRALVEEKLGALRGARRRIDQAFERVSQCDARKKVVVPALEAFFKKR